MVLYQQVLAGELFEFQLSFLASFIHALDKQLQALQVALDPVEVNKETGLSSFCFLFFCLLVVLETLAFLAGSRKLSTRPGCKDAAFLVFILRM